MGEDKGFLSRWSQRKAAVREGKPAAEPAPPPERTSTSEDAPTSPPVPVPAEAARTAPAAATTDVAPPTLDDVARLERGDGVSAFMAKGVDPQVRNAALKKLFADPHFNVMDGLDVYIDDYGQPDPLPASMLRQMAQSHALGLFDDETRQTVAPASGTDPDGAAAAPAAQSAAAPTSPSAVDAPHDDDPALRLQPDDAAGPSGPADGAGPDAGRQR